MVIGKLLLAFVAASDAAEERANPIRKVVNMLQAMQKKVEAEGAKDKELFDKFMCYCKTGVADLEKKVGDANTKIPNVQSDIEESEAAIVSTKAELKQAQADRADAKAAMAAATSLREKEAASYAKESTELKTNIGAITKAVAAIDSGMAGGFLQTDAALAIRKLVATADYLYDVDRQDLMSFLGQGSGYAPASGEISGILKNMGDKMSADLKSITASEDESIATYEELMSAKKKEVEALNTQIEAKLGRVGELGIAVVQMKNDLTDTQASLIEDTKFLKDIKKDCSTKADEYAAIVKNRQEELLALAETIKILNDDDALELFKKTLPGAGSALLQMRVNEVNARQEALTSILRAQDVSLRPRPRLDFIAMAIRGKKIGFEKVIKMIDEMLATLKQEQLDDDNKKEYCAKQFDFAEDKKKGLETKLSNLETSILDAQEGIAKLKDEIDGLEDSIKATDKSVAEMTVQRQEESKDYQELMASDSAAKELLGFAKNRLNKFYNPKLYKPPAEEAPAFVQISAHKQEPPAAPGAFKKKSEESSGVVAMIDLLIKDLDKELTEAEVTEKNSQKDYEAYMRDSAESRAEATKALTDKMATSANLKSDLEAATDNKGATTKELMATESYISSLHAECDWLLKYFDMRKEARNSEVDSLANAKAVLSGANFALIQVRRNMLRRSRQPSLETAKENVVHSQVFQAKVQEACKKAPADKAQECDVAATSALFCQLLQRSKPDELSAANCTSKAPAFVQLGMRKAPEDDLAQEMTHDLEMNFNKIAPFGKEDTAKELQDHAAKTQDTLVDAVENAEVAEIKRAVFRALTRLRAATIKEFDTIARLETQAIDAYNDAHHYRAENPLTHLHEDEAPVETDKLKSFH